MIIPRNRPASPENERLSMPRELILTGRRSRTEGPGSTSGTTPLASARGQRNETVAFTARRVDPVARGTGVPVCHAAAAVPVSEQILGIPPGRPQERQLLSAEGSECRSGETSRVQPQPIARLRVRALAGRPAGRAVAFGLWPGDRGRFSPVVPRGAAAGGGGRRLEGCRRRAGG
jgi:hypothetical protein